MQGSGVDIFQRCTFAAGKISDFEPLNKENFINVSVIMYTYER